MYLALLTPEFGLIRARAQALRKPGAKLAPALQTLSECEAVLLRGKDGWRLSGATLVENWAKRLPPAARIRAGRIASLLLKVLNGESADPGLYTAFSSYLRALSELPEDTQDVAECVAALSIVRTLGLDGEEIAEDALRYEAQALRGLSGERRSIILRVNRGLKASGL